MTNDRTVICHWSLVIYCQLIHDADQELCQAVGGFEGVFAEAPEVFGGAEAAENGAGGGAEFAGEAFLGEQVLDLRGKLVVDGVADYTDGDERSVGDPARFGDGI